MVISIDLVTPDGELINQKEYLNDSSEEEIIESYTLSGYKVLGWSYWA